MLPRLLLLAAVIVLGAGCRSTVGSRDAITVTSATQVAQPSTAVATPKATKPNTNIEADGTLEDKDPRQRIAAARHLGASGDAAVAVPILVERLGREQRIPELGLETPRSEMVEALGALGGAEATAAICEVLKDYLHRGPRLKDHIYRDGDYYGVVRAALVALRLQPLDTETAELLRSIASDPKWAARLNSVLQEEAWRVVLEDEMRRAELTTNAERISYLLELLTASGSGHKSDWLRPGIKTPTAARNSAITKALSEFGSEALEKLDKARTTTAPSNVSRLEALAMVRARIAASKSGGQR